MDEIKKSNIGFGKSQNPEENKKTVTNKLKEFFSPELINRLDNIYIFNTLSKKDLAKIAALEIAELNKQLTSHHTKIYSDKKIFDWFVEHMPEKTSAREIRRQIRKETQKIIAELILKEKTKTSHKLILEKNKLAIR
jgi:ATP-dependent Clp protease ATP-binding subunit ClpC